MHTISIDIETYSSNDLNKCGVYKYVQAADFDLLLFGYAVDGGAVQVVDLAKGEEMPKEILEALSDESITKWAFNSNFERICLSEWLRRNHPEHFTSYSILEDTVGDYLDPHGWKCSMIWSAYMGLPLSLAGAGAVLGLEEQKMKEGKDLIRYFCVPCKATKSNGGRTRNLPEHDMEKWDLFKAYNQRDVEVGQSIQQKLAKFPVPDFVWDEFWLDQEICDRGIAIDRKMVEEAIALDEISKNELSETMCEMTSLDNPNSVMQMKQWLSRQGIEMDSLGKKEVAKLIEEVDGELKEVLQLRQQLAKSSVKKYVAMQNAVCDDGRARGMFQFYGANRSGRWAGRIIQLQNLPQNHMEDLEEARGLVRNGDYAALSMLYNSVPEVLSELIRTAFVARDGYKFVVSDFSAIEARVLSWLAGEKWRTEVFVNNGDVPQGRDIFPQMTVEENIELGLQPLGGKGKIPDYIYDLFPILPQFAKRKGGDLSGGQQQQLAIARALVAEPKILILDEPTEGIQPSIIQDIGKAILKINEWKGITVLLVEQYLDFVLKHADYIYVMEKGEIIYKNTTAESDAVAIQKMMTD